MSPDFICTYCGGTDYVPVSCGIVCAKGCGKVLPHYTKKPGFGVRAKGSELCRIPADLGKQLRRIDAEWEEWETRKAAKARGEVLPEPLPPRSRRKVKRPPSQWEIVLKIKGLLQQHGIAPAVLIASLQKDGHTGVVPQANGHTEKRPLITAQRPKPLQAPSCKQGAGQYTTTGQETQLPAARTVWRKIGGKLYQVPVS